MRFKSRGLVHAAARLWDIDGQVFVNVSIEYLSSMSPVNMRGVCGEQALAIKGFDDVVATREPLTCLFCLSPNLPGT